MAITNPEAADAARDALLQQEFNAGVGAVKEADIQAEVMHGDTPETVTIDVAKEHIDCRPLGVGERLRPIRKVQQAEREGDDLQAAEAILDMIDMLGDAAEFYSVDFFDRLDEDELRDAYRDLSEKSSGGNARAK